MFSKMKSEAAMCKLQEFSVVEINRLKSSWRLHTCVLNWMFQHQNAGMDEELFETAF